jgi:general secretion pathway protein E
MQLPLSFCGCRFIVPLSRRVTGMTVERLGEMMIGMGFAAQADISQALALQSEVDAPIGALLVRLGAASEDQVATALSRQLGVRLDLSPDIAAISDRVIAALDTHHPLCSLLAWRNFRALPLEAPDGGMSGRLKVITDSPLNMTLPEIAAAHDLVLDWCLVTPRTLDRIFSSIEMRRAADAPASAQSGSLSERRLKELAEQAPIIELVNNMFSSALASRASDIHVEPFEDRFQVRFRIDGVLRDWSGFPGNNFDPVVSRIKLLSGMDISERRKPQDGRQSIRLSGKEMDLRVSALPGPYGESVVLRLLDKARSLPTFVDLGMGKDEQDVFKRILAEQHGIVLVTGPTGSGKSTTLYKALSEMNTGDRKIITIEDPIEYQLEGVNQTQVQSEIGYTFASGLRAVLRQDPDIIMIGEIRDAETAQIAVQSALTGHLVLSTVHTNTALAGVLRLADLGVERFLLGSALRGLMAQRLLRKLCISCAAPDLVAKQSNMHTSDYVSATGCDDCAHTGYKGRFAVYEVATITSRLQAAIANGADEDQLEILAREDGFTPMRDRAMDAARSGMTSLAEVERVFGRLPLEAF